MIYVKIDDTLYPATIAGLNQDRDWQNRESKTIRLEGSFELVNSLFTNATPWSVVMEEIVDVTPQFVTDDNGNPVRELVDVTPRYETSPETGEILCDENGTPIPYTGEPVYQEGAYILYNGDPIYETQLIEYDNSEYSVRGDLLVHTDGTCTVKMGKPTELEALKLSSASKDAEVAEANAKNAELQDALNILLGGNV